MMTFYFRFNCNLKMGYVLSWTKYNTLSCLLFLPRNICVLYCFKLTFAIPYKCLIHIYFVIVGIYTWLKLYMYVPINIWLQTVTYIATTIYLKKYFLYVTKI